MSFNKKLLRSYTAGFVMLKEKENKEFELYFAFNNGPFKCVGELNQIAVEKLSSFLLHCTTDIKLTNENKNL